MTSVVFEILLALTGGARHGYSILTVVNQRPGGRIRLHAGSLYRAIARLVEAEMIEEVEGESSADDMAEDSRRRYYALTPLGRRTAELEAARLASQVEAARDVALIPRHA